MLQRRSCWCVCGCIHVNITVLRHCSKGCIYLNQSLIQCTTWWACYMTKIKHTQKGMTNRWMLVWQNAKMLRVNPLSLSKVCDAFQLFLTISVVVVIICTENGREKKLNQEPIVEDFKVHKAHWMLFRQVNTTTTALQCNTVSCVHAPYVVCRNCAAIFVIICVWGPFYCLYMSLI